MKTTKLILTLALLYLVVAPFVAADNSVAGVLAYEDTEDNYLTINNGESTNFLVWSYGFLEDYILVSVDLLDSSYNQVSNIYTGKHTRLSGQYEVEFSDTFSVSPSSPGDYIIRLEIVGESGAKTTQDLSLTTLAGSAPTITITDPQNGGSYESVSNLYYTTYDVDGESLECRYNDGESFSPWTACSNSFSITTQPGSNTFTVYTKDAEGNIASDSVTFTVQTGSAPDTTAPIVSITNPKEGEVYTSEITELFYSATDANLDTCWYSIDEGETTSDPVACSNSFLVNSKEGINVWNVYAQDTAGNIASDSVTFVVNTKGDTTKPIISVISPENGEELDYADVDFKITVNEECSEVVYEINGENHTMSETSTWAWKDTLVLKDETDYTVTFYATDMYDNMATKTISFSIDEISNDDNSRASITVDDKDWENQFKAISPEINAGDDREKTLNWWQRFINWLCRIFGLTQIY